jgi:N-acetylmuramoyl-L-alanine amidase
MTACLLLAFLALPAAAVRMVPVTVDDILLGGTSYLEAGVTSTPMRTLCDTLGGWTVYWDAATRSAVAEKGSVTVTARPGESALRVNGTAYPTAAAVYIRNGRTYVPLRTLCEALGLGIAWDSALGGAAVTTGVRAVTYSDQDLYWLSRIISAESAGEPLNGQIAVGNVVLNRVASSQFPDTIQGVVFDAVDGVQFEPVANGTVYNPPTAQSVSAARAALAGTSIVGQCLYFYAPALSQGVWINANRTYFVTIGCHRFYL